MAQEGPLLASVRRLAEDLPAEEIVGLPEPTLPVRLWSDDDERLRVDVLVGLGAEDPGERERTLRILSELGLRATTWTGHVIAGSVDLGDIGRLLDTPPDIVIDAAAMLRPTLDVTVAEAWNVPPASRTTRYTGQDVIVGIVDTGIDVTHPSLWWPTGRTRVLSLWDQGLRGATQPPSRFGYGSEWDAPAIDAHLSSPHAPLPLSWIDVSGHGTGVAGIAAGNGQAAPVGRYVGIAESAELVVVALDAQRGAFPSTANVIDAVQYVFDIARRAGMRAVVNLSHGVQIGPHEPAGQLETGLADLLAADDERLLVVSAGNTGSADAHARIDVADGETVDLQLDVPTTVGSFVLVDIWYDRGDLLGVELTDPSGATSPVVRGNEREMGVVGQDRYEISGVPNVIGVRANQLQVLVHTSTRRGSVTSGRWTLRVHGLHMHTGAPVDAWLDRGLLSSARFSAGVVDTDRTITAPATADGAIAVGSYRVSPTLGLLSSSSGRGPDRRGSPPRLLAAPGETVTTCRAGSTPARTHVTVAGTSYAAAHVTGALAVLLQSAPALTRAQALDCVLKTARSDADTKAGPSSGWGAGKLDIAAALACARGGTP
jgi:subtilisin family serine protease